MTKAIILAAGQGSRLLPLTADRPKCLIEVGGKAILDHQVDAVRAAGVQRIIVVGGYRVDKLATHLAARGDGVELRINPFWALSSSIGSVWAARDVLGDDFILLNGDTVYQPDLIRRGLDGMKDGVSLFVEPSAIPELDDMLVALDSDRIGQVGKTIDRALATHRSLGIVAAQRDEGAYRDMLDTVIACPDGPQSFHHLIVHELAQRQAVHPIVVADGGWVEIDRPEDIAGWKG